MYFYKKNIYIYKHSFLCCNLTSGLSEILTLLKFFKVNFKLFSKLVGLFYIFHVTNALDELYLRKYSVLLLLLILIIVILMGRIFNIDVSITTNEMEKEAKYQW